MDRQNILLQIEKVSKLFPGVRALDNVTFSVASGEVHGLVGENGAGKSTLMVVASGALIPEEGRVVVDGVETMGNTEQARALGLAIVRQEPALMPDLTVAENLFLGVPTSARPSLINVSAWAETLMKQWGDDVRIRVLAYQIGSYMASGTCFAVAGMLLAGFIGNASQTAGNDYLMPAIAAVVVGGTPFTGGKGSVIASAVAALFMAQLGQMVLAMGPAQRFNC